MRVQAKPEKKYSVPVRMVLKAQKKKYGMSLLPSLIWGRSPWIFYGLQLLYRAIDRRKSPLDPALRSLVMVRVSQLNRCSFCTDINSALLRARGVSAEKVLKLSDDGASEYFTHAERAALAYAEEMTRSEPGVTDETFERLRSHFGEEQIIELTALIAYQNLSSKFNAALDIPSQDFCARLSNSGETRKIG